MTDIPNTTIAEQQPPGGVDVVLFTCVSGVLFQRAIGAYQMAHFLRAHGYSVQVIDHTDNFSEDELISMTSAFVGPNTLALGISSTFYSGMTTKFIETKKTFDAVVPANLENAIRHAKNSWPKLKIVFGGARSAAGETLDYVDCVIHGYGEDKFLSYLNRLPGNSKKTKVRSWELAQNSSSSKTIIQSEPLHTEFSIQHLDHAFTAADCITANEVLPIEVSRGCIFKCKFCAYPLNGKKKMDYLREVEFIKAELIHNYEQFGTTNYFIGDDTFNDSTVKIQMLHAMITSLPFKIQFTCYLRIDLLYAHQEQIPLLREMGLVSPFFGIESLNQKSASAIGKGMNTKTLKKFIHELYYDHWNAEVPFTCSFIIGLPHETEQTIAETFEWVKTSPVNAVFFPLVLDMKSMYQSEFNKNYADYGYTLDEDDRWTNNNFTQERAEALAIEINDQLMYSKDSPSSWFLLTLLNHGLSLDQAKNTRAIALDWPKLIKAGRRRVQEYKKLLLSQSLTNPTLDKEKLCTQ